MARKSPTKKRPTAVVTAAQKPVAKVKSAKSADSAKSAKPAESSRAVRANALVEAGRRAEDLRAKRARTIVEQIRKALRAIGGEFLELGRAIKTVYDDELHRPLGYDSFEALLVGEKLGSRTQAFKLMAVAAVFAHVGIEDFGIERAHALIAYTRATPAADDPAELLQGNAVVGGKPLRDSSVEDILRARREVLATEAAKTPASAAAKARQAREREATRRVAAALKAAKLPPAEFAVQGRTVVAKWALDDLVSAPT